METQTDEVRETNNTAKSPRDVAVDYIVEIVKRVGLDVSPPQETIRCFAWGRLWPHITKRLGDGILIGSTPRCHNGVGIDISSDRTVTLRYQEDVEYVLKHPGYIHGALAALARKQKKLKRRMEKKTVKMEKRMEKLEAMRIGRSRSDDEP